MTTTDENCPSPGRATKSEASAPPRTASPPTTSSERAILVLVTLSLVMVSMSVNILSISLPTVARGLEPTPLESTWLLLISVLVSTCLLVTLGRVADMVGRRAMLLTGLALFTVGAILAGASVSASMLIIVLAFQGVGTACVMSNTGAIIGSVFGGNRLAWAMGIYLAGISTAQVLGPTLGGLLSATMGWRWIFWAQVPLGVFCWFLGARALRALPTRPTSSAQRLDVPGAVIAASMLVALLCGISSVQTYGPLSLQVGFGFAMFIVLAPILVFIERRTDHPILRLDLLRRRSFLMANLSGVLSVLPRFATIALMGMYFQIVLGDSPLVAGLKVIPMPIGVTIGSVLANRVIMRFGLVVAGAVGSVGTAIGAGFLAVCVASAAPFFAIALTLLLIGLGGGLFGTASSTLIVQHAAEDEIGAVNGLRITLMNIGGMVGIAVSLALATSQLSPAERSAFYRASTGPGFNLAALQHGFLFAFLLLTLAALGSAIALVGARSHEARRERVPG
ncbi:MFS transporter [Granulicoccus phenolivorans]|uniref:MFS transporter n=1 Tax=Granulicoccus phenolivorans TaxID=266854 RepID=UPI0009DBD6E4|nr:MFS transporter [Granulicoccus phenolivorans]